jgi:hypothetical protein
MFQPRTGCFCNTELTPHQWLVIVFGVKQNIKKCYLFRDWKQKLKFKLRPVQTRVARWFVFKAKIPILVNFGGPWNGKFCLFYDHLEHFTAIWYNLWPFGLYSL